MHGPTRPTLLLCALFLAAAAAFAGSGEITILGTQTSGDYGTESDSDRQSTLFRFLMGDRTQLRIDLELARIKVGDGLTYTPLGPVPTRRPGPQGPPDGSPGQGGSQRTSSTGTAESTTTTEPIADDWSTGLGDVRFGVSHRLLGGGAKIYRLDATVGLKAPTADEADGLGTGEWDYRVGLAGEYRFWSSTAFGGVGLNVLGDPEWVELADVADAYAGIETEPLRNNMILSAWLEGNEEVVAGTGTRAALGLGVRTTGKLRLRAQLTYGLGGSAEDLAALVGASFGVRTPVIGTRTIR